MVSGSLARSYCDKLLALDGLAAGSLPGALARGAPAISRLFSLLAPIAGRFGEDRRESAHGPACMCTTVDLRARSAATPPFLPMASALLLAAAVALAGNLLPPASHSSRHPPLVRWKQHDIDLFMRSGAHLPPWRPTKSHPADFILKQIINSDAPDAPGGRVPATYTRLAPQRDRPPPCARTHTRTHMTELRVRVRFYTHGPGRFISRARS